MQTNTALRWVAPSLPAQPWPLNSQAGSVNPDTSPNCANDAEFRQQVTAAQSASPWCSPTQPVVFISDLHADAQALIASLLYAKVLGKQQSGHLDLTDFGRQAQVVIGGDCLDKGPSNLGLLRTIKQLQHLGVNLLILAGNHDMRLYMGLRALSTTRHPLSEHFFLRMGEKAVPLLAEVYRDYGLVDQQVRCTLSADECRQRLFPGQGWFDAFARQASAFLHPELIDKELKRMRRKQKNFEKACKQEQIDIVGAYLAANKARELFLTENGEFAWFYKYMQLVFRTGSYLFLHAGVDDQFCQQLSQQGIDAINQGFCQQRDRDLFHFYYGTLANSIRTKYRRSDPELTPYGSRLLHQQGIHALVHGHVSHTQGQQLTMRAGLLHIEGDITLDRHSRQQAGLPGVGAGAILFLPDGQVKALSCDYPYAKVFRPIPPC